MKIIKKNQLAILVIALMLITAGYLNYDTNYKNQSMDISTPLEENVSIDLAALGDAELVNANVEEENVNNIEEQEDTNATVETVNVEEKQTEVISSDDYFAKSKLERNVMYSQMIGRYQDIIASNTRRSRTESSCTRRNK